MERKYELFLQALHASLKNESVFWDQDLSAPEWVGLFQLAEQHHVLPLIYEAVYRCPAAMRTDTGLFAPFKQRTVQTVMLQTMKTSEFLVLYKELAKAGVSPLVVKGLLCRNLYPNPDYRISGDEDLVVPEGQFALFHDVMLQYGMECADPDADPERVFEVPYRKKGSPLYIEAHKSLFPPDSEAYGDMNAFFAGMEKRSITENAGGTEIRTMSYTDHLFYLICHAMKHWLHAGCGIRQVCDIILMANVRGREIDWETVRKQCREIHAELFAAAVFRIGERYLGFDPEAAGYPDTWKSMRVDEIPLLTDMLAGGVYGSADRDRLHSSTITLNAVAAQKKGKRGRLGVWKSVFPGVKELKGSYPCLQKYPFLLPAAWIVRIRRYTKEISDGSGQSAADSLKIGEQRVELLRMYGILSSE